MRPALLNAVLSTVHAGGEQGCELDHLEPFSFGHPKFKLLTYPSLSKTSNPRTTGPITAFSETVLTQAISVI
jgi:hypothetical protein